MMEINSKVDQGHEVKFDCQAVVDAYIQGSRAAGPKGRMAGVWRQTRHKGLKLRATKLEMKYHQVTSSAASPVSL